MSISFENDIYPDNPKILFIGIATSTHTISWINLLEKTELNIRLFAMPGGQPEKDWPVQTYVSRLKEKNTPFRRYLYNEPDTFFKTFLIKIATKLGFPPLSPTEWLADVIKEWKPDIIHTLGLFDDQGGEFYLQARHQYHLENIGKWVLQLRGGSDMALRHNLPECQPVLQQALNECDYLICDNYKNIEYCEALGIQKSKFAPFVPVSGMGGMDLTNPLSSDMTPPSKRERIILWPKAYEWKWSKATPVLEAIRTHWELIKPCEIFMLAVNQEAYEWFMTLPEEIRQHCHLSQRVPRSEVIELMKRARIMLAPSVVDGIPNSLYEAMAYGAFPIVSPLNTITPVIKQETNVLYARNLYPDEIAQVIIQALNDDKLVDEAAKQNLVDVKRLADREKIQEKVCNFYEMISKKN